jgi:hypothetical protein
MRRAWPPPACPTPGSLSTSTWGASRRCVWSGLWCGQQLSQQAFVVVWLVVPFDVGVAAWLGGQWHIAPQALLLPATHTSLAPFGQLLSSLLFQPITSCMCLPCLSTHKHHPHRLTCMRTAPLPLWRLCHQSWATGCSACACSCQEHPQVRGPGRQAGRLIQRQRDWSEVVARVCIAAVPHNATQRAEMSAATAEQQQGSVSRHATSSCSCATWTCLRHGWSGPRACTIVACSGTDQPVCSRSCSQPQHLFVLLH